LTDNKQEACMMNYTITLSANGKYIEIQIKGEIDRESAMRVNLEAHALGRELGIHHYLTDLSQCRNTESTLGNYEFAYADMKAEPGIDRLARVAVLVSPDDHSHDFVETVARNTGLDVTIYTDRELAIARLLQV
jgi:hypothetical protein